MHPFAVPAPPSKRPETEPNWLRLPRRSAEELWAGLRARNWTSKGYE
jgi:hypothetical protein